MDNKKASLVLILVSLACFISLVVIFANQFLNAQRRFEEATTEAKQTQETLEDLAQYYANYSRYALLDIAKYQKLCDQYLRDFGADSAYYLDAKDHLDRAKLRENDNLWFIDREINGLVSDGTITYDQGIWLKNRVYELRNP